MSRVDSDVKLRCQVSVPVTKKRPKHVPREDMRLPRRSQDTGPHPGPMAPGVGLEPTTNGLTVRIRRFHEPCRVGRFQRNPLWHKGFRPATVLNVFRQLRTFRALSRPIRALEVDTASSSVDRVGAPPEHEQHHGRSIREISGNVFVSLCRYVRAGRLALDGNVSCEAR